MRPTHPALPPVVRILPLSEIDDSARQQRNRKCREQAGDDQRRGHRQRQELEKRASDTGKKGERKKNDNRREARSEQRRIKFPGCRKHCRARLGETGNAGTACDMLDHNDDVIDQ